MKGYRIYENSFADISFSGPGMLRDERYAAGPSFRAALRFWCKLGWISFGGIAAHLAIMHDELVEKKRWISNRIPPCAEPLHDPSRALKHSGLRSMSGGSCMASGGGIVAGTLFVLPSMFILAGAQCGLCQMTDEFASC
jgi:Chromate transporter